MKRASSILSSYTMLISHKNFKHIHQVYVHIIAIQTHVSHWSIAQHFSHWSLALFGNELDFSLMLYVFFFAKPWRHITFFESFFSYIDLFSARIQMFSCINCCTFRPLLRSSKSSYLLLKLGHIKYISLQPKTISM